MEEHQPDVTIEQVDKRLSELMELRKPHILTMEKIFKADSGYFFPFDFIVSAVLNRSLSMTNGFFSMIESRNYLCGGAILRLQLDSIMRLYAFYLVDDPHKLAMNILAGGYINKYRDRKGKKLTDAYLRTMASDRYEFIDRVYKRTSSFIHLSSDHIFASINDLNIDERHFYIELSLDGRRDWPPENLLEAVDAFIAATEAVLDLCVSWAIQKESVGRSRPSDLDWPPWRDGI